MRTAWLAWELSLALWTFSVLLQASTLLAQEPQRCKFGQFSCKDGSDCLPYSHLCDGDPDCADGSDEDGCTAECSSSQFQCSRGQMCIERTELCDDVVQCQDGSDEDGCFTPAEGCDHRCDKKHCLARSFICDGDQDCADGSDEADCDGETEVETFKTTGEEKTASLPFTTQSPAGEPDSNVPLYCPHGSKACKDDSICIRYDHVCDGEDDCPDGSDEEECLMECEPGQFQCTRGKQCIERRQVCDNDAQCRDQSDEAGCFTPVEGCPYRCDKKHCLSQAFVCDGEKDCADGSDEVDCGQETCSSAEFHCSSGQCVALSMKCDGHPDCKDRSDEEGCPSQKCSRSQWFCPQSEECVQRDLLCDGQVDCKDGSDEQNCKEAVVYCGDFQWRCASETQCIPKRWHCDGTKDCRDESDEKTCEAVLCPAHQFRCGSGECLNPSHLCNGVTECQDGSDEGGDCASDVCADQSECSHACHKTPMGKRCLCREGFSSVDGGLTCVDVDECVTTPLVCSHSCTNSEGSFQCSCNPGYVLESNGRTCNLTGQAYLLAAVQKDLFLLDLKKSSPDVLLSGEEQPVLSVDYDWQEQKVYWVNMDSDAVKWITLDQTSRGTLITGVKVACLAVDWVGRSLYWTDKAEGRINCVRLEGSEMTPVVIVDVEAPQSMVLMPQRGLMFWSQVGAEPQIERAGMDGSDRRVLVRDALQSPAGLAVDPLQERLYWTDEALHYIGSATLEGGDIKILQIDTPRPFSLAVVGDMMYWSDPSQGTIQNANKLTGKQSRILLKRPSQPLSIKAVHELLQPKMENPCESKQCSHQCVLTPGLVGVCKCPPRLVLGKDGLTCSEAADSTILLLVLPTALSQVSLQNVPAAVGLADLPEHQRFDLPKVKQASVVDLVQREQKLYVWDVAEATVSFFKLREETVARQGTLFGLKKGMMVTAMAVDYTTMNMFWSVVDQPGVYVTSANGSFTTLILGEKMGIVQSIALHPPTGRFCYSNSDPQGTSTLLECANMDGEGRSVVWDGAKKPISLSLSEEGNRLYWADTSLGLIGSVGVDGSGFKSVETAEPVVAFTLSNKLLIWLTKTGSTKCWFSEDHQSATLWFEVKTDVLNMKAFSKPGQNGTSSCGQENGGCSQLCLPTPGGRTCRCGRGFLLNGETKCAVDPRCPSGSESCFRGEECMSKKRFCDGNLDCADGSDEICVPSITPLDKVKGGAIAKIPAPKPPALKPSAPKPSAPKPSAPKQPAPKSQPPTKPKSLDEGLKNQSSEVDIRMEGVDATCGTKLCNGNGACVKQEGETVCECMAGFSGDRCEKQAEGALPGPVIYAAVGLGVAVVVLGAVIGIARKKKAADQRQSSPIVRETSMRDLGNTGSSTQEKDPENPQVS